MKGHPSLHRPVGLLVLLSLCAGPVVAQDDDEKPTRMLRILAVGETPPFIQKIINGVRVEQEAPAGSIPPRRVVQLNSEGEEKGNAVRLQLDNVSAAIPAGAGTVSLHSAEDGAPNSQAWHGVKMPKSTHALALLWRDPREKKWTKAMSLTLPDDLSAFPPGTVRIVNVSPWTVGVQFNGKNIKLPKGRSLLQGQRGTAINDAPLVVALKDGNGKWHKIFDSVVTHTARERTNVIIYRADGEKPRRPAKVYLMREAASLAPVPKRRNR